MMLFCRELPSGCAKCGRYLRAWVSARGWCFWCELYDKQRLGVGA